MADRLTQLQDCLDQLLTQMFATIRYIDTYHPYSLIDSQSDQNPFSAAGRNDSQGNNAQGTQATDTATLASSLNPTQQQQGGDGQQLQSQQPTEPPPDPPALFNSRLQELAQDLVLKEQQIEVLVDSLPGLGNSQAQQEARIRELEQELRDVEAERREWGTEKEKLVERVEGVILGVRRV